MTLGIGDDCAILQSPAGHELLVTTDFSLEGRHFDRAAHPARSVGHRCLARGLSDLAAMGATPLAAFLSLALPAGLQRTARGRAWVDGFLDGLLSLARNSGTSLAGGDTSAAPGQHILADIVLTGAAPRGRSLRRSGARAGDALYVTGSLGGSAAELAQLLRTPRRFRSALPENDHPHLFPRPRLLVGQALRRRGLASAAIDVSDGLSTDLHHLCAASGVGAMVEAAALPIHALAATEEDGGLALVLHGGEDYELLFAARPTVRMPRTVAGVPVRRIGRLTRSKRVLLERDGRTEPLDSGGWEHTL
ncbi:thiamine-phosphate kinase [Terriglobus aquaticus]